MMVFLAVLLNFVSKTSKFRHSVTKKRQLLGPRTPYRGFAPGPQWGTFVPQTPGPTPFAHSKYATEWLENRQGKTGAKRDYNQVQSRISIVRWKVYMPSRRSKERECKKLRGKCIKSIIEMHTEIASY